MGTTDDRLVKTKRVKAVTDTRGFGVADLLLACAIIVLMIAGVLALFRQGTESYVIMITGSRGAFMSSALLQNGQDDRCIDDRSLSPKRSEPAMLARRVGCADPE